MIWDGTQNLFFNNSLDLCCNELGAIPLAYLKPCCSRLCEYIILCYLKFNLGFIFTDYRAWVLYKTRYDIC